MNLKYDFSGQKIGILQVIRPIRLPDSKCAQWECLCDCGNTVFVYSSSLKNGQKSCGCMMNKPSEDLSGLRYSNIEILKYAGNGSWEYVCLLCNEKNTIKTGDLNKGIKRKSNMGCPKCSRKNREFEKLNNKKFGRLTVLDLDPIRKKGVIYWRCICECGNIIEARGSHLKDGGIRSCGCILRDKDGNAYEFLEDHVIGYTSKGEAFKISKQDHERICGYTWYKSRQGYIATHSTGDMLLLHRFITNAPSGTHVDHINRDKCDNRIDNLRVGTESDNMHNRSIGKNNTSGVMGVRKDGNLWIAKIMVNRKEIDLGKYEKFEDAAVARLRFELESFGREFASQRHLFNEYGV